MSEEKFTIDDAENEGMIKAEVGTELKRVLSRDSSKLYQKFYEVCAENERDPADVLGDMALRAINDEAFAEELAQTTIDIKSLEANKIRKEDLQLVLDMKDELGLDESQEDDPIDRLIEQRIQAMASGPLDSFGRPEGGREEQLERKVQQLEARLEAQNQQRTQGTNDAPAREQEESAQVDSGGARVSGGKEVDDLLDRGGEGEKRQEEEREVQEQEEGGGGVEVEESNMTAFVSPEEAEEE